MTPGTCVYCGCSEDKPCPEGCAWVDETRTLCDACQWAAEVAPHLVAAIEQARGVVAIAWPDRPLVERQVIVRAVRPVLAELVASYVMEESHAAIDLARLATYLRACHPQAVADAIGSDATAVDVAIKLLGERRIVLP